MLNIGKEKIHLLFPDNVMGIRLAREEFCTNSTLHRGFYHPSPVYDILVGNTQRGCLKKRLSPNKLFTHRYLYNNDGILTCIETYFQSKVAYVEYLFYGENQRIGVTIDREMRLAAVSEEVFDDGHIITFSLMNCVLRGEDYECFNFQTEIYHYDATGLIECELRKLSPVSMHFTDERYFWEREDGYLTAYTNISSSHGQRRYLVKKKRKAKINLKEMAMPEYYN